MRIYCNNCNYSFERKTVIDGEIIEEYNNIYGTFCPKCNFKIKSEIEPEFVKKNKENKKKLKSEVIKHIKDKWRKQNGN